jgi:hypothetical protein
MPERIQRKRTKGWRMPEGAVYVGRPTRWGNPFVVGSNREQGQVETRELAVRYFRDWILHPQNWVLPQPPKTAVLRGFDLACWCSLDQLCHADVLLEIANA